MQWSFTAVVFDMDGTLFDSERLAIEGLQDTFREYGISVSAQALETVIGRAGQETREYLGQFVPDGLSAERLLRRASESIKARIVREGMPVKPGVRELLGLLREHGVSMGLATSTRSATARDNLQRAAIEGYFGTVIGGDDVERHKPHPEVYLRAVHELRVMPAEAVAVEDSDLGIQAASAAGLRVIHVPDIKQIDVQTKALVYREYRSLLDFHADLAAAGQA
jgi:HAD superfamily hydrolase (TIGR01509 family)